MKTLLGLIIVCVVLSNARAQVIDVYTPPADVSGQTHKKWVARDSNAMWKHAGPDTGLITLRMRPWGYFSGHLLSRDSTWIVLVTESGQKQELLTSKVIGVSDFVEVSDSERNNPADRHMALRFNQPQSFFAPVLLGGMTFPNLEMKGTLHWSAMGIFGLRIPALIGRSLGVFVGGGYETRMFSRDTGWMLQYLSVTPGLSYRGIVSLGLSIEWPITAKAITYSGWDLLATAKYAGSKRLNVVLEPRVAFGLPIARRDAGALMLLLSGGYPLTDVFASGNFTSGLRLPEISIGISYVLPLFDRYRRMMID